MSFLNLNLLWGLPLVAVPIVIHILNRRRFRIVDWGAMEFLLQVEKKNRRRVRLEQLILLLLRVLAVALLVFLVSRPYAPAEGGVFGNLGGHVETEHIVVLDDSASMGQRAARPLADRPGDDTVFEQARALVARSVESPPRGWGSDELTVILASRPDLLQIPRASLGAENPAAIVAQIEGLALSSLPFDPVKVMEGLKTYLASGEGNAQKRIYIVSDFRSNDWAGSEDRTLEAAARLLREIDNERVDVRLVDLGPDDTDNVGVVAVESAASHVTAGGPTEFRVRIRNYGLLPTGPFHLDLKVGELTSSEPVEPIQPGETVEVRAVHTFHEAGIHPVSVALPPDRFAGDDAFHIGLRVEEAVPVLVVDGEPSAIREEGETYPLEQALRAAHATGLRVAPEVIPSYLLPDRDLAPYAMVILANVNDISAETVGRLETFVAGGGGLAIFLGDLVPAAEYNEILYREGEGLLPAPLDAWRGDPQKNRWVRFVRETAGNVVADLYDPADEPLHGRVKVFQYFACAWDPESPPPGARRLLAYNDEARSPAVLEKGYGDGRVILCTTSCDREWTNWPAEAVFPFTVREIVAAAARPTPHAVRTAGEAYVGPLDPQRYETQVTVRVPSWPDLGDVTVEAEPAEDGGGIFAYRYPRNEEGRGLDAIGIYRFALRSWEGGETYRYVGVNVPPGEGDLARVPHPELTRAFGAVAEIATGAITTLWQVEDVESREFWRSMLVALLAVLVMETFLGWKFARHR